MLNVYTRHSLDCEHAGDPRWRRCRCPKWVRGVLPKGEPLRKSAKTRSWEKAEHRAREMEAAADPATADQGKPRRTSVREAVEMFLNDEEARGLEASSRKKSRTLFERQFRLWCEARKLAHLDQLTPTDLTEFRASWGNGEVTTHRKHERMVSFFSFCVRNELLHKNAMEALKKPKTPNVVPTDYFRPDEFQAIVKAAEKYEFGGGTDLPRPRAPASCADVADALVGVIDPRCYQA